MNTTHVENIEAVITKITGSAWLMGMHKFFQHVSYSRHIL
ncbi:hypothetical protein ACT4US_22095 [Bacillus sp. HC-Mk]